MGYWKWQFDRNKDILIFLMWFITSVEIIGFIMFMGFILGGKVGMGISLGVMSAVFVIGWLVSAIIQISKNSYAKYLNSIEDSKPESNKDKIYNLICAGKYASEIAKELEPSRPYICKIIKELEAKGYIQCRNKKSVPKYYIRTEKKYI